MALAWSPWRSDLAGSWLCGLARQYEAASLNEIDYVGVVVTNGGGGGRTEIVFCELLGLLLT